MKTTIELPDALLQAAKAMAVRRGTTLKAIITHALKREVRMVPNIDGNGFVSLNRSSSDLTKEEMSDVMELIYKFGAEPEHPVNFQDPP